MEKGSYTLFLKLRKHQEIGVGALGKIQFKKGFYAYNGSAFGSGGFSRIKRHRKQIKNGEITHWHIDYLLTHSNTEYVGFIKSEADIECQLSKEPAKIDKVEKFGCSDCKCSSHLLHSVNLSILEKEILSVHRKYSDTVEMELKRE